MNTDTFDRLVSRRADLLRRKRMIKGDIEQANKTGNNYLLAALRSERPLLDAMLEMNFQEIWVEVNAIERKRKSDEEIAAVEAT